MGRTRWWWGGPQVTHLFAHPSNWRFTKAVRPGAGEGFGPHFRKWPGDPPNRRLTCIPPIWSSREAMTWVTYAILSAFFGALVAILGKIGVRDVDSNLAVALRTVVIVFFAWGIVLAQGNARDLTRISRHSYLFLFLSAIATGCSWLFYYKALKLGEASRVAPIDKLSVALAVAMAFVFLGEKPTLGNVLGAVLITAGVLVAALVR